MEDYYFKEFFNNSPTAYPYHKVILNAHGVPSDYEFLAINKLYEDLMGISASKIMNKRFYDVFPKGWKGESKWKDIFNGAILKQKTTLQSALIIAEKLRKIMENSLIAPVGNVTSSFGVSERKVYESFKSWYKRADKALYLAKESGRNRVVASNAQEEPVASVNIEWKRESILYLLT